MLKDEAPKQSARNIAVPRDSTNIFAGVGFLALGAYVLWEATKFEDVGATMPNFVGVGMIILASVLILASILRPQLVSRGELAGGSMLRRAIFVIVVAVWVLALPVVGFLASSIVAFAVLAASVPKAETWNLKQWAGHVLGGAVVTLAFWYVLTRFLNVPLP